MEAVGSGRSPGTPSSRSGSFRAHARRAVRLRALVTHVSSGWQRHAPVENLGLGGARVLVDQRLAPGDAVTVSFTAPTLWDPLVLRARVAWVAPGDPPYRAGLAFEHRTPEAAFALYELMSTLAFD